MLAGQQTRRPGKGALLVPESGPQGKLVYQPAARLLNKLSGTAAASRAVERYLATAHLEAVPRVDGLDVEHFAPRQAQDTLLRCRQKLLAG